MWTVLTIIMILALHAGNVFIIATGIILDALPDASVMAKIILVWLAQAYNNVIPIQNGEQLYNMNNKKILQAKQFPIY